MSRPSDDVPDVVVLPPVLVGGTLLLGLGLHYFFWSITLFPVLLARLAGVGIFVASGILAHTAHRAMQRVGTNVLPTQPTLALALDGPYRHTRNPLYLAAIGFALGVCLWVDGLVPLVLLLPMTAILHFGVVLREEAYLLAKFGEQYEVYRRAVPRWF
ncbi:MAG: isoprenylcysteine carboxylmethyltransferase family protein [Gemmatimonadaceae bacterium]